MPVELDAAAYGAGDAFQAEKRTVFSREWLALAHEGQLPAAGDFVSSTIGGWPVFAVRDAAGSVRAFRNLCRHQSMQVVEKPAGQCRELRCRYHGWTYDLQGRFAGAPAPVAPADAGSPDNHLHALPTVLAAGLVLFTLEPSPGAATLGAVGERLARLAGAAPRHAGSFTTEVGANWKACIEHSLQDGDPAWHWPVLLAREHAGGIVIEQVMPRTFLRTRIVHHHLVAPDDTGGMPGTVQARAEQAKAACEALQAQRTAGVLAPPNGAVEGFHRNLARAYAGDAGP